jgi:hypothetical protein
MNKNMYVKFLSAGDKFQEQKHVNGFCARSGEKPCKTIRCEIFLSGREKRAGRGETT